MQTLMEWECKMDNQSWPASDDKLFEHKPHEIDFKSIT